MNKVLRLAFLLVSLSVYADAGVISLSVTATVTGPNGGMFNYSYLVTNLGSSDENLYSFVLGESGPLVSVTAPAGWSADLLSTPGFVIWTSADPTTDMIPGATGMFGFSSSFSSGQQSYLGFGSDPTFGFPTGDFDQGSTIGPTVMTGVPEPATLVLLLPVLVAIGWRVRFNNRSETVADAAVAFAQGRVGLPAAVLRSYCRQIAG